jgi:chromate reductase, NAD(P)H dehydrogenase (quinone)
MKNVAVIVGSLRRESINLRLAKALAALAAGQLDCRIVDLADVPLYNDDLWADPPPGVLRLKQQVEAADAVLFVTPEYNRSLPAVTKNAIDWGTRPAGKNSWAGKPAAIVGTSPGAIGTAVAQAHLRGVLVGCGLALMGQPEVSLQTKPGLIADDFSVTDEKTRAYLAGFIAKFAAHIAARAVPVPAV